MRRALSKPAQRQHASAIAGHLQAYLARNAFSNSATIAAYWPTDGEVDLRNWLRAAHASGMRICLPVIDPKPHAATKRATKGATKSATKTMQFFAADVLHEQLMQQNRYGIAEPRVGAHRVVSGTIDLMLLPLVAFDNSGTRLGMGGGYYDRYLAGLHNVPHVGVAHEVQRSATALPRQNWDVTLAAVVTETGWHNCEPAGST